MTKNDWVGTIQAATGLSRQDSQMAVNDIFRDIANELADGGSVLLPGIGTLKTTPRAERRGTNPKTHEPIVIPATRALSISPTGAMKRTLAAA